MSASPKDIKWYFLQHFKALCTKSKEFKLGTTRKMSKGQHMWNIKDSKFYLFVSPSKKIHLLYVTFFSFFCIYETYICKRAPNTFFTDHHSKHTTKEKEFFQHFVVCALKIFVQQTTYINSSSTFPFSRF